LAGKVLLDLAGCPMLERVVNRVSRSKTISNVVIATTIQPCDDTIVGLCESRGWKYFRGNETDVLDRYYQSATTFKADIVVRITADCPLIEPEIIDRVSNEFLSVYRDVDYVSNTLIRTFPRGLDVEIISYLALTKAWQEDQDPASREHVTPYIWRQPDKFRIFNVANDRNYSHMRWTVDTAKDLAFIRKIYDYFKNDTFSWREVMGLLKENPELLEINRDVQQKAVP